VTDIGVVKVDFDEFVNVPLFREMGQEFGFIFRTFGDFWERVVFARELTA
jgi:hypothetical protein